MSVEHNLDAVHRRMTSTSGEQKSNGDKNRAEQWAMVRAWSGSDTTVIRSLPLAALIDDIHKK
jgi:hypothetical protein